MMKITLSSKVCDYLIISVLMINLLVEWNNEPSSDESESRSNIIK